jgi:hypothetical protein
LYEVHIVPEKIMALKPDRLSLNLDPVFIANDLGKAVCSLHLSVHLCKIEV